MSASAFLCSIVLLTFLASLSAQYHQPQFLRNICSDTNYTRNSTYSSNLKTLLSSLSNSKNTTFFSNGFQSNSLGDESSDNMVSGLFLCRGDVSPDICRECVVTAANDTLNQCPQGKEATSYYEECMLHYADRKILLDPVTLRGHLMQNPKNITKNQSDRFTDVLFSLINDVGGETADSSKKFAVKEANFTNFQTIYVMAQCIPVLTRKNCIFCLQMIIDVLPLYKIGARILRPSCSLRYELYPFYNETLVETHLPPPVSSPSLPPHRPLASPQHGQNH